MAILHILSSFFFVDLYNILVLRLIHDSTAKEIHSCISTPGQYRGPPRGFGKQGKQGIFFRGTGEQSQILRGTGEQRQYWGTGNIRKQIFDFWGTREQANLFQGNRYPPPLGGPQLTVVNETNRTYSKLVAKIQVCMSNKTQSSTYVSLLRKSGSYKKYA